jgi:hypothetical protein
MDIDPNWFAYLALLIWPVIALILFSRLPVGQALIWTILGAYLLLPVGAEFKLNGVPAFNKLTIPSLAALVCSPIFIGRLPKFSRGFGITEILVLALLIGPIITSLLNTDPIRIGGTVLPGSSLYDGLSAAVAQLLFILPFFLARDFLRSYKDNSDILRIMAVAGSFYAFPMLFEIRMSPELHIWIYGYAPDAFLEQMRGGGFRPMVFIGNGLRVAFFAMTTAVAAAALWRTRTRAFAFFPSSWITAFLSFVLLLCKTLSAAVYAVTLIPIVRWAKPRIQFRVASLLVIVALVYPLLRAGDMVPTNSVVGAANAVSTDRGESLRTRFENEDRLLDHALKRPWFGWGRFGRERVYANEEGDFKTIEDGQWIIQLGTSGLVGFIAQFGLLAFSVLRAATALKFAQAGRESEYLAALGLVVAISIFNLLPNSTYLPWTWLLAGALLGRAEALSAMSQKRILLRSSAPLSPPLRSAFFHQTTPSH